MDAARCGLLAALLLGLAQWASDQSVERVRGLLTLSREIQRSSPAVKLGALP